MKTSQQIAEEMLGKAIRLFLSPDQPCHEDAMLGAIPLTEFIELAIAVNAWNTDTPKSTDENVEKVGAIIDALEKLRATRKAEWLCPPA